MTLLFDILHNIISFILVITVLVFVHEYGHYIIARFFGVRVKAFSIGMGKEIAGFNDRQGTKWKLSLLPIGGYVSLFGHNEFLSGSKYNPYSLTEVEKSYAFDFKPFYQKILIVLAGPIANLLLAIVIYAFTFKVFGYVYYPPIVSSFEKESSAQAAGMRIGDKIIAINDRTVHSFDDIKKYTMLSVGNEIKIEILRHSSSHIYHIKPNVHEVKNALGDKFNLPKLGISSAKYEIIKPNVAAAFKHGYDETINVMYVSFKSIIQLFSGERNIKEVNSFIKISQYTGHYFKLGVKQLLVLTAILSINLAIINLLPIPALDGGYALIYLTEPIIGKDFSDRLSRHLLKVGLAFIICITIFSIFNDLRSFF